MDGHLSRGRCGIVMEAADALGWLSVGVMIIKAGGEIIFSNAVADRLFSPLRPVDHSLAALLDLSLANGKEAVADAVEQFVSMAVPRPDHASLPFRIQLGTDQVVDCRFRQGPDCSAVMTMCDVTAYAQEAERATRDALTGLVNRLGFHERLAELASKTERNGPPVAVICLDLDRFKIVNDTLGHPTGDALLVKVAQRLSNAVRKGDTVARLGGDEFAILQTDASQPLAAEALAARLVDLIGRTYMVGEHMIDIGVSLGIAVAPTDGHEPATLLKHADLALYRAKADGKGTFRFFRTSMDAEMQIRRAMETDLRRALGLNEFELVYQPQFDLASGTLTGFEALLRWRSPARGFVSPGDFIPLAEEIGLINAIGTWVLRKACVDAATWERPISVAVNISALQFSDKKLVSTVNYALASAGLQPSRLELEITEGALLEHTEAVIGQLQALKGLGVRISMDDFGTGYSSLSYLQKFPFDKIKIDQSFVRSADSASNNAIVCAVAALGASLGIKTTAEGVETKEQLDRITAQGCNEVQGYLTGRPLNASAAAALVTSASNTAGKPRNFE